MAKSKTSKWRWGRNGGYYAYADGVTQWVWGLSAPEKKNLERIHGRCLFYTQDDDRWEAYERVHFPWHFKQVEATKLPTRRPPARRPSRNGRSNPQARHGQSS